MVERIRVCVVYADPAQQWRRELELEAGATVAQALAASGVTEALPGYRPAGVGIFGRRVSLDAPLHDGDRIELYRPLRADPKESRRRRARSV
jgi:putative ubiquitin-RnfH superfamily antitoxin RatB of RatAB toxin-antitoxin module